MALSFGFGLSQNMRDAEQRNIDKRKKNRDAFQAYMDAERKAGRPLSITDLENQRYEITGGNYLYSNSLASDGMIEKMHQQHNQGVFDDQLAQATKNVGQIETRNKALESSISADGSFEDWKRNITSKNGFLGPDPDKNMKMFTDMGWDNESQWHEIQQRKRREKIDTIFTSDSFTNSNFTVADVNQNYASSPDYVRQGLVNKLQAANKNKTATATSSYLGGLFKEGVNIPRYFSFLQMDDIAKKEFAKNALRSQGIQDVNITDADITNLIKSVEQHFENNKKSYSAAAATEFEQAFSSNPKWKQYQEAAKSGNVQLARGTWEKVYQESAAKLGFSGDLFIEDTANPGKRIINPKIAEIVGYKDYNAWQRLNYAQNYSIKEAQGVEATQTFVTENVTPDKSKSNVTIYFSQFGSIDDDKGDNPYLTPSTKTASIFGILTSEYYMPMEKMAAVKNSLDGMMDNIKNETLDIDAAAAEIAAQAGLQKYEQAKATVKGAYKELYTDGLPPNSSIQDYGTFVDENISKYMTQITDILTALPEDSKTTITIDGETVTNWSDPSVAVLLQKYKDNLVRLRKDVSRDLSGHNLGAFGDATNEMMSIEKTFTHYETGEEIKVSNIREYREYLLGHIDYLLSKESIDKINKIEPTGTSNKYTNSMNLPVNIASYKGSLKQTAQTINAAKQNKAFSTSLMSIEATSPDNMSFFVIDPTADTLTINPKFSDIGAHLSNSGTSSNMPNRDNTPFFGLFKDVYTMHGLQDITSLNQLTIPKQTEVLNAMMNGLLFDVKASDDNKKLENIMNKVTIMNNTGVSRGGYVDKFLSEFPTNMSSPKTQQDAFIYATKSGAFGKKNTTVQFRLYLEQYINTILQNKPIFEQLLEPSM